MQNEEPQIIEASPQTARLLEVLQTLEVQIKKQNSLKYSLLKGAVYGIGTVIGASVLVALFGSMYAATMESLSIEINPTEQTQ